MRLTINGREKWFRATNKSQAKALYGRLKAEAREETYFPEKYKQTKQVTLRAWIARHLEGLTQAAAAVGPGVLWRAADVTDLESLNAALAALTAKSGPCDILLYCAGAALPGRFLDVPAQEFQEQWRLNVGGAVAGS